MNQERLSALAHAKDLFLKSIPLSLAVLAQQGIILTDAIMLAVAGQQELSIGALGFAALVIPLTFSFGTLSAVSIFLPRCLDGPAGEDAKRVMRGAFSLAVLLTVGVFAYLGVFAVASGSFLPDQELSAATNSYLFACAFAIPALLCAHVVSESLISFSHRRAVAVVMCSALVLNALLNQLFLYGWLFIPPMGATGVGVATAGVAWASLGFYLFYSKALLFFGSRDFGKWGSITQSMRALFAKGWPIGLHVSYEELLLALSTVVMAGFGAAPLAAHRLAILAAGIALLFPVALSQVVCVSVSRFTARGETHRVNQTIVTAAALAFVIACVFFGVLKFAPPALYASASDPDLAQNAYHGTFLTYAAILQLLISVQLVIGGAIRGLGNTGVLVLASATCLAVAATVGGYLFIQRDYRPDSVWWALCMGIFVSTAVLAFYLLLNRTRKTATRKFGAEGSAD